jgi:hypothetical protein
MGTQNMFFAIIFPSSILIFLNLMSILVKDITLRKGKYFFIWGQKVYTAGIESCRVSEEE